MSGWPITFAEVLEARERLRPHIQPTPLRSYPELDRAVGARVLVKHENFQPTGAFKVRNALSALTLLSPEDRRGGVVAASRGNHGLGLAWAGRRLEIPVTVCVPHGNNPEKNAAIRAQAVMALAYTGEGQADELVKIYRESDDPELRQAALEGLMIQGSVDQLIELARAEKDPRIKKQIVEILAVTGSEKAVAYLMELIDG